MKTVLIILAILTISLITIKKHLNKNIDAAITIKNCKNVIYKNNKATGYKNDLYIENVKNLKKQGEVK